MSLAATPRSVSDRLVRLACYAYPAPFRRRFRDEIRVTFREHRRVARRDAGPLGAGFATARSLFDILRAGLTERLAPRRRGAGNQRPGLPEDPHQGRQPMNSLAQDFRYAARTLRKSPVFTLTAALTLALGIGANTGIFALVDGLLFRPLPGIAAPDELVAIYTDDGSGPSVSAYMDYGNLAERLNTVSSIAAYKPRSANVGTDGTVEQRAGMLVTGSYFGTLGARAAVGRLLGPEDDIEPDGHPVAVISHGMWRQRFGGDPGIVGRDLQVNGRDFTIVGVASEGFRGTWIESGPDIYVPMMMQAHMMPGTGYLLDRRGWGGTLLLARIADGESRETVQAELEAAGAWLRDNYRETTGREYVAVSFAEGRMFPEMKATVVRLGGLLFGVAAVVLFIACLNVTNLLLARGAERRREIAIRQALGAGRGRILGQMMAEHLLLGGLGGGLGLVLGIALARSLGALPLGLEVDVALDARMTAFCIVVSLLTAVFFGLVPARRAARRDVTDRLREGDRGAAPRRGFSSALVVAQVAVSVVMLVAAGLFVRTLTNLARADLGFDPTVATLGVDPGLQGYSADETAAFYRDLRDRLRAHPGVRGVTFVNALPGPDNENRSTVAVEGNAAGDEPLRAYFNVVGPDYFEVLAIPVRAGRGLLESDDATAASVMVVNASAAALIEEATGQAALGSRLSPAGPDGPFVEVVGVVADSTTQQIGAPARPTMYWPQRQILDSSMAARMYVLVRGQGDPEGMIAPARAAVRELDDAMPLFGVGTLAGHMSRGLLQQRLTAGAMAAAGVLALTLALVGLYGILTYAVNRRTAELGIRMALGARSIDVLGMVLRQAGLLLALGGVLGFAGALAASRLIEGFLFDVPVVDPLTYAAVAALMLGVGAAAAWLPARRATSLDPARALRAE